MRTKNMNWKRMHLIIARKLIQDTLVYNMFTDSIYDLYLINQLISSIFHADGVDMIATAFIVFDEILPWIDRSSEFCSSILLIEGLHNRCDKSTPWAYERSLRENCLLSVVTGEIQKNYPPNEYKILCGAHLALVRQLDYFWKADVIKKLTYVIVYLL